MNNMGNQIGDILKDIRSVVDKAQAESRTYDKTSKYIYKPDQARFKLVIWFKDGNKRVYYSYDHQYHNKEKHIDEHMSLIKLLKLANKHVGKYKYAVIYATLDPDRIVKTNYSHVIVKINIMGNNDWNKAIRFEVNGKDNLLHLKHLDVYSQKEFITN
jgi:hypothetical protein